MLRGAWSVWPTPRATESDMSRKRRKWWWGWRLLLHPISDPQQGLAAQRPEMAHPGPPEGVSRLPLQSKAPGLLYSLKAKAGRSIFLGPSSWRPGLVP